MMTQILPARKPVHASFRLGLWASVSAVCFVLASFTVFAQKATVSGKVTDKKSKDAIAARINVPSAKTGAVAKLDGSYTLSLPAGTHQLIVTFPLYKTIKKTITVAAGDTQTLDIAMDEDLVGLSEIVVVGTRRSDRTVVESPVAIDVIPAQEMRQSGLTETNQMIQMAVPSFNFPRTSIADGTDAVRPATIRGLGPDQLLVLVNGKRRYASALINVNGTVGRGSAAVDLNAIPANMIERIEVLRDGAAAQYGSDAIAGVLNVILRSDAAFNLTGTVGQTTVGDGRVIDVAANAGFALPNAGSLHIGATYRTRDSTNRSGGDFRQQYSPASDPRNPTADRSTQPINHWWGDGKTQDLGGFFNLNLPINELVNVYAFGGYMYREVFAPGFFRRPLDVRNDIRVYPNGFLPLINSKINDLSGAVGIKGGFDGWTYDLSNTYGQNAFNFNVINSWNASLGPNSPRNVNSGTLFYQQNSTNLDIFKSFDIGLAAPLSVAFGGEFRLESYRIIAGQPESWWNQANNVGANTPPRYPVTIPASQARASAADTIPAAGIQVFPGFKPTDETNTQSANRNNLSLYLDLETKPFQALLISAAARFENYSDFGPALNGKFAFRLEPVEKVGIRGAVSTGFRAPSLQQNFFSATATNFIGGIPFDIATFPVSSPAAKVLGAQPLKPERSLNISGGITLDIIDNFSFTADYYYIGITDRIVLTGNFTVAGVRNLLAMNGLQGIGGGRFFTNAVDTRTNGIDIIARYGVTLPETAGQLRFTLGMNFTRNEVTRVSPVPRELSSVYSATDPVPTLFDRVELTRMEFGQPQSNIQFTINYDNKNWNNFSIMLRNIRFGEVRSADIPPATTTDRTVTPAVVTPVPPEVFDQTFSAKIITDIDISIDIVKGIRFGVGANNLLDVYPDTIIDQRLITNPNRPMLGNGQPNFVNSGSLNGANAVVRYPNIVPFGANGRFIYGRISFTF
ncbi:MAG: TonB-dependent receptor [Candidatus Kapabacteria bacterium]|nr:TonB-dependent receptor [Candidatus Kapabacteria bacterium]